MVHERNRERNLVQFSRGDSRDPLGRDPSGKPVSSLRVWKGESNAVATGFATDQQVTLPKGKAEKLALSMTATEPLLAPVTKGQRVGTVKVSFEGAPLAEFPLVALADVPAASMLGRAWDTVRLWFK